MQNLTFITGNQHKVEALEHWLGRQLKHHRLDLEELQVLDPHEVIQHKTAAAYAQLKSPVLVEDTSLVFHALGRLPGVFVKWFLEEIGPVGMCTLLDSFEDKSATARVIYGLHDGKTMHFFEAVVEGSIADRPRGTDGFGWDPIFIPNGSDKTYAEMRQTHYSVRNQAVQKLKQFLDEQKQ